MIQAQKYQSDIYTDEKIALKSIMFIAGFVTPSIDDAWKFISKKATEEMLETVGEKGAKRFIKATTRYAGKSGQNGIKKLTGNGIDGFMYEAKVVSSEIGMYRLLGNMNDEGIIVWEAFKRTH